MSTRRKTRLAVYAALALAAGAGLVGRAARSRPSSAARGLGEPAADFTLRDAATGRPVSLAALRREAKAVTVVFTGIDCPVGNLYMPRLVEMDRAYRARGVAIVAINANDHESAEQVAAHAREHGVEFPVLKDPDNRVADALLAERTCEALVFDHSGRLRYRGAIDDQYGQGSRKDRTGRAYLAEALDAILAGRAVASPTTPVVGCPIERAEPSRATSDRPRVRPASPAILAARKAEGEAESIQVGPVTYAADVAPILVRKCQSCHRPKQAGPFSLLTCEQARRWATTIREVVDDGRMPPWHADPRFGRFENDRGLSPRERATLLAWVDQGAPLGDPKTLPPPAEFPDGWSIGRPDAVVEMAEPYVVEAQGAIPYRRFRVPTGFTEDRWVQAAEARPGDRSVVHHMFVFVEKHDPDPTNLHRKGPCLVGYTPGDNPSVFPPGTAKLVPAGSDFLFEIHYSPIGRPRIDRSRVAMIFARGPVAHEAITRGIPDKGLRIPPGAADYESRSSYTFPADAHLLSLMPHMHLRGKDFLYRASYPDGRSEVLLSVPAYDFGWQTIYRLADPKPMPKGTRIDCLAHFDNSSANPANPDPTKEVRWGDQTWDEMMIGYIDYYLDAPGPHGAEASDVE
jgi:peroxiredoxin